MTCFLCSIVFDLMRSKPDSEKNEWELRGIYGVDVPGSEVKGHKLFATVDHSTYSKGLTLGSLVIAADAHAWKVRESYDLVFSLSEVSDPITDHLHVQYIPRFKDDGLRPAKDYAKPLVKSVSLNDLSVMVYDVVGVSQRGLSPEWFKDPNSVKTMVSGMRTSEEAEAECKVFNSQDDGFNYYVVGPYPMQNIIPPLSIYQQKEGL